jgi:hypothetical protein
MAGPAGPVVFWCKTHLIAECIAVQNIKKPNRSHGMKKFQCTGAGRQLHFSNNHSVFVTIISTPHRTSNKAMQHNYNDTISDAFSTGWHYST